MSVCFCTSWIFVQTSTTCQVMRLKHWCAVDALHPSLLYALLQAPSSSPWQMPWASRLPLPRHLYPPQAPTPHHQLLAAAVVAPSIS